MTALAALDLTGHLAIVAFAGETSTLGFGYTIDRIAAAPDGTIVVTAALTTEQNQCGPGWIRTSDPPDVNRVL